MNNDKPLRDKYSIIGEIAVRKEKFGRYCKYAMKIEKIIENNEPNVPTAWLKTLLSYYVDIGDLEHKLFQKENRKKIEQYTADTFNYFANQPDYDADYNFSGEYEYKSAFNFDFSEIFNSHRRKPRKKNTTALPSVSQPVMYQYSLETLLKSCVTAYLELETPPNTKDKSIRFFIKLVTSYADKYFNEKDKDKLKPYKKQVIAGCLTLKVAGFRLSQKVHNKCTNPNIFEATRNALRPKKNGIE